MKPLQRKEGLFMDLKDMTAKDYAKQHGISTSYAAIVLGKRGDRELQAEELLTMLYNWQALYEGTEALFITASAIDAVSIEDTLDGQQGAALAIGEGFKDKLLNFIDQYKAGLPTKDGLEIKLCKKPLIVAMPSDAEGLKLAEEITAELNKRDLPVIKADITGNCKTINEALRADKEKLKEDIETALNIAKLQPSYELKQYLKSSASDALSAFTDGIKASADTPAISTGFNNLDRILEGGLYEGLYIIGAVSSLGKTTYALQIIDQIAQSGQDCLIFSLEMAKTELIGKSISRLTYQNARKTSQAKTTRGITAGARYDSYSQEEKDVIQTALQNYSEYAKHIFIHEGVGDIGVKDIREAIKRHISITGKKPIVLIDYVQILAAYNDRFTDKQNTDRNIIELKRISRDYKIPVIGISSFNRDNYTAPVNMAAFKESGAVEYSADVLIALQYEGMDYQEGEKEQDRLKRIRELMADNERKAAEGEAQYIQLKVLKNRNGKRGSIGYNLYAKFNYFKEDKEEAKKTAPASDIFAGLKAK